MASAWSESDDDMLETNNGLILGPLSSDITLIRNLFQDKEQFNFKKFELYKGDDFREAYYIISKTDFDTFQTSLNLYFENFVIEELNQKEKTYKLVAPYGSHDQFASKLRDACGIELISGEYIKCTDYQKKIINNCFKHDDFDEPALIPIDDRDVVSKNEYNSGKQTRLNEDSFYDTLSGINLNNDFKLTYNKFSSEFTTPLKFEYHHTLKHENESSLEIILCEKDITRLEVDAILNPLCIFGVNSITSSLNLKAGHAFKAECRAFIDSYLKGHAKTKIFHSGPGDMLNIEYILSYVCPESYSSQSIRLYYEQIYNSYKNIFEYANMLKLKSLAITFLDLNDELEYGMIALYNSLQNYLKSKATDPRFCLKQIYVALLDKDPLVSFKNYLINGYSDEVFNLMLETDANGSYEEKNLNDNDLRDNYVYDSDGDDDIFDPSEFKNETEFLTALDKNNNNSKSNTCPTCSSKDYILNKNEISDNSFFKKCRKSKLKGSPTSTKKCDICMIINEIAQISFQSNKNVSSICLKCAIEASTRRLEPTHCSSCLRDNKNETNLNRYCSKHKECNKCNNLPVKLAVLNCYYCNLYEFYAKLTETSSKDLIEKHQELNCCRDYCHISNTKEQKDEEPSFIRFLCGHIACKANQSKNLCLFCSIHKTLDLIKKNNGIKINEIEYGKIEQEVGKEKQSSNKNAFNSYYENYQMRLNQGNEASAAYAEQFEEEGESDEGEEIELIDASLTNDEDTSLDNYFTDKTLEIRLLDESLSGYEGVQTLVINVFIPDGFQTLLHPKPGEKYYGICNKYYLPYNEDGKKIQEMISKLFALDELFQIVPSKLNPDKYVVGLADIELKTSQTGGKENNGYPDMSHLETLKAQLVQKINQIN